MCGIVGYVGKRDCTEVLLNGLGKLEYRGYDSAGIAVFQDGKITVAKSKGRLKDLEEKWSVRADLSGMWALATPAGRPMANPLT